MLSINRVNFNSNTNSLSKSNCQNKQVCTSTNKSSDKLSFRGHTYCGLTSKTKTLVEHLAKYLSCFTDNVTLEARTNNNEFMHLNLNPNKGALTLNVMKKNDLNDFSNSKNFRSYDLMLNAIKLDPSDNATSTPNMHNKFSVNNKISEYLVAFADKFKN